MITVEQELCGVRCPSLRIGMHRAKRFSGCDPIANFAMQNNSDRWVNCIFLLLAPTAENYACGAYRFAVHGDDIAILGTAHVVPVFCARKFVRIVEGAGVPTLEGNHLAELFERFSREYELLSLFLALGYGIRSSAEVKHPAGKFETQFPEIVRPASAQHIQHFHDFEGVADVRSKRLIHVRDQCDH